MTLLLTIAIGSCAAILLLPVSVLFVEAVCAHSRLGQLREEPGQRGRLAIIMPAHNESLLLAGSIEAVRPQLDQGDRLLVVADNCTDSTADIAKAAGAEVIERNDPTRHGKGYALDFGIRHLALDPVDVVIVIDADCNVAVGAIDELRRTCLRTRRPVQALYLMHAPPGSGFRTRLAEFAWIIKNRVRPLGLRRLGLPCQLMGTGMAFPWSCIRSSELATGHIVEDLKLGLDLTRAGHPPYFCPEALVTSYFPSSREGVQGQRERWEHGHLGAILAEAPSLLWLSLRRLRIDTMMLALDLSVPPLSLIILLIAAVWFLAAGLYGLTSAIAPLTLATIGAAMLVLTIFLCWWRFARHVVSFPTLAMAGIYALWKVPLYIKFIAARRLNWVRSKRGGDGISG